MRRSFLLYLLAFLVFASLIGGGIVWYARHRILESSEDSLFSDVDSIPPRKVGLVLGAAPRLKDGRSNYYFRYRIEAAADLYKAGKVSYLLVSGDNRHLDYDEPSEMQQALIARGVPAAAIFCDYAGLTTLDSVVRAQKVFQENDFTIISQKFHNQRAIFLASHYGIDAIGFNARDVSLRVGAKTMIREQLARVRALWDAAIYRRQPRFLGPPVTIGPDTANGCPSPYPSPMSEK